MTRQNRTNNRLSQKSDRWTSSRVGKSAEQTPIDQELKTLQDRKSDMSTLGQMLARLRAERR